MMDATELLKRSGVRATRKRVLVLAAVMAAGRAESPGELLENEAVREAMDRATLYRTLDLLADKGLVVRTQDPDRTFHYCMGLGSPHDTAHSHFYCTRCGHMSCLPASALSIDASLLPEAAAVGRVEARVDGVCAECMGAGE